MPDPYTPPSAAILPGTSGSPSASLTAKIGALLQLAPVIGIIGTIRGMRHAFETLGTNGVGDPSRLSAAIGEVLISTFIGSAFGLIGCVLLGIAVFGQGNQHRWVKVLFWVSTLPVVVSIILLFANLAKGSSLGFDP